MLQEAKEKRTKLQINLNELEKKRIKTVNHTLLMQELVQKIWKADQLIIKLSDGKDGSRRGSRPTLPRADIDDRVNYDDWIKREGAVIDGPTSHLNM